MAGGDRRCAALAPTGPNPPASGMPQRILLALVAAAALDKIHAAVEFVGSVAAPSGGKGTGSRERFLDYVSSSSDSTLVTSKQLTALTCLSARHRRVMVWCCRAMATWHTSQESEPSRSWIRVHQRCHRLSVALKTAPTIRFITCACCHCPHRDATDGRILKDACLLDSLRLSVLRQWDRHRRDWQCGVLRIVLQ